MHRWLCAYLVASLLVAPAFAVEPDEALPVSAPPSAEPPSGTAATIVGAILVGVGGINLLTVPVCRTDFYGEAVGPVGQDACLASSLILGGGFVIAGVPVLLTGLKNRREHAEWEGAQAHLGVNVTPRSGQLVIAGSF